MVLDLVLFVSFLAQPGCAIPVASDSPSPVARRSGENAPLSVEADAKSDAASSAEVNSGAPVLGYAPGEFARTPAAAVPTEPSALAPIVVRNKPLGLPEAPRPALSGWRESSTRRHEWYGMAVAAHGAAAFDAWSTRRAISAGAGAESNPLLRPFANSGAVYAATQVCPAFMDFLGRRMMRSPNPWMRKMWWVPQSAGMAMSLAAGVHNIRIVQ